MIEGKKVLALIPARGGSKGIKGKNVAELGGKPLISYSIEVARESKYIDYVLVSTDDEEIRKVSIQYGAEVPFLRPAELASDTARTIDVMLHAIQWLENQGEFYDIVVLLQPTQPLRRSMDIDRALETYLTCGEQGVVSVREVEEHPLLLRTIGQDGLLKNLMPIGSTVRRQDMPAYYLVEGSIYVNGVTSLNSDTSLNDNPVPYCMDKKYSIDIDEPWDMKMAEMRLAEQRDEVRSDLD